MTDPYEGLATRFVAHYHHGVATLIHMIGHRR
jgi:hypothetical protein